MVMDLYQKNFYCQEDTVVIMDVRTVLINKIKVLNMKYKIISVCDNYNKSCSHCSIGCVREVHEKANEFDGIIIDMKNINSLNSFLVSVLVEHRDKCITINCNNTTTKIFDILGVKDMIKNAESESEAIDMIRNMVESKKIV